jgi:hypothetical protein
VVVALIVSASGCAALDTGRTITQGIATGATPTTAVPTESGDVVTVSGGTLAYDANTTWRRVQRQLGSNVSAPFVRLERLEDAGGEYRSGEIVLGPHLDGRWPNTSEPLLHPERGFERPKALAARASMASREGRTEYVPVRSPRRLGAGRSRHDLDAPERVSRETRWHWLGQRLAPDVPGSGRGRSRLGHPVGHASAAERAGGSSKRITPPTGDTTRSPNRRTTSTSPTTAS